MDLGFFSCALTTKSIKAQETSARCDPGREEHWISAGDGQAYRPWKCSTNAYPP